jgi:RHS repeat-associated protein
MGFKKNRVIYYSYKFTGKERDEETGYDYFGARYYDSDLSQWLSVDPMSDKYPSLSAYNYCAGNPLNAIDPNGKDIVPTNEKSDQAMEQHFKSEFGDKMGTTLYGAMHKKLDLPKEAFFSDINKLNKEFNSAMKTLDNNKELKEKAKGYFEAIKSDRRNYVDIFSEVTQNESGKVIGMEDISEKGTIKIDGFEFNFNFNGKKSTTVFSKNSFGLEGSYSIIKTENSSTELENKKYNFNLTPNDNERIYESIKIGNEQQ